MFFKDIITKSYFSSTKSPNSTENSPYLHKNFKLKTTSLDFSPEKTLNLIQRVVAFTLFFCFENRYFLSAIPARLAACILYEPQVRARDHRHCSILCVVIVKLGGVHCRRSVAFRLNFLEEIDIRYEYNVRSIVFQTVHQQYRSENTNSGIIRINQ